MILGVLPTMLIIIDKQPIFSARLCISIKINQLSVFGSLIFSCGFKWREFRGSLRQPRPSHGSQKSQLLGTQELPRDMNRWPLRVINAPRSETLCTTKQSATTASQWIQMKIRKEELTVQFVNIQLTQFTRIQKHL